MPVRDLTCDFGKWKQLAFSDMTTKMKDWYKAMEIAHRTHFLSNPTFERAFSMAPNMDEVYPGIYVSGESATKDFDALLPKGIRHVLNMAIEVMSPLMGATIKFTKLGIDDCVMPNVGVWKKAADIIKENSERPQVINCHMGISRSVTAVIAYRMLHKDEGFVEALTEIRKARPEANPHPLLVRGMMRDFGDRFKP